MKEKKLTDEEIVKALERCIDESMGCVGCPYHGNSCRQMDIDVLDLIHRLQDENGKLKTLVSHFEQLEKQLSAEIERLKNFIDFKTANVMCDKCKEQAVKDTAREILGLILAKEFEKGDYLTDDELKEIFKERYGIEVE